MEDEWGKPVDPQTRFADALESLIRKRAVLAFVHAETSTGARSDVKSLCRLCATEHDCLSIVDMP